MRFLLAATMTLMAAAPPSLPVASPTQPWVVDFGTKHCLASMGYLVGDRPMTLGLQPVPTTEDTRVFVEAERKLNTLSYEDAKLSVGDRRLRVSAMFVEPVTRAGFVRYSFTLKKNELAELTRVGQLTVNGSHVRAIFPIANLPTIKSKLDECVALLLESWGLSRDAQANIASFPKPQLGYPLITGADYPLRALSRNEIGGVEVLLSVSATGKITGCRLVQSSGHSDLDVQTCGVIQHENRLEPARDKQGRSVPSLYYVSVHWVIR